MTLGIVDKVELLPFHKMGEDKWKSLDLPYTLTETPIPSREKMQQLYEFIEKP